MPPLLHTHRLALALILGLFVLLRFPMLLHQAGGQDEQYFAVPGWTVWTEGVPRIPYLPSRNRASFFEGADRCLMTLPPALYYCQAPFFSILPATYWPARLPSFLGALAMLVLTYHLARRLGASQKLALIAVLLLALSRQLMFTSIIARPDLLCALCGLGAFALSLAFVQSKDLRIVVAIGSLCGLGALFHPFALVFCIQSGVAMLLVSGSVRERLLRAVVLTVSAVAVMCLWLPLILSYPEEFSSQFFSNVLERAGPGLHQRILWPWASIEYHASELWTLFGPWQFVMLWTGISFSTFALLRSNGNDQSRWILSYAWSSVYLTATVAGEHTILGYWLYATAIVAVVTAVAFSRVKMPAFRGAVLAALAIVIMLPGAGLRTSWIYLRHFGSPELHAHKFISSALEQMPHEGLFVVDPAYAFDVYASGRDTLLCAERELYWGDRPIELRYMFLGWEGTYAAAPDDYDVELVAQLGDPTLPQACTLKVYEPKPSR